MIDLAIIPARAGSKRVPGKNTKLLCGKPLIQWTVEAVEQSRYIKDYIISTNIPFILEKYEKAMQRPEWLCGDDVSMAEVVKDVLLKYPYNKFFSGEKLDRPLRNIILLQPTSPLRTVDDINDAYFIERQANEGKLFRDRVPVVSVCKTTAEKRMYKADENPMQKQIAYDKSIDEACYMRNSAIFIFQAIRFIETNQIIHDKPLLYKMPKSRSIDIDTEEDWNMAEALCTHFRQNT